MLARTHGQTATPTTVGKELANVAARLRSQSGGLGEIRIMGKMNGAVGNFNAHVVALPQIDWPGFSSALRRIARPCAESAHHADRAARLDRRVLPRADARQHRADRSCARHVELHFAGLLQAARHRRRGGLLDHAAQGQSHRFRELPRATSGWPTRCSRHFAEKLPLSRMQRDLTDSTVMRNLGVAVGTLAARVPLARSGPRQDRSGQRTAGRGFGRRMGGAGRSRADRHAGAWDTGCLRSAEDFHPRPPDGQRLDPGLHRVVAPAGCRRTTPARAHTGSLCGFGGRPRPPTLKLRSGPTHENGLS